MDSGSQPVTLTKVGAAKISWLAAGPVFPAVCTGTPHVTRVTWKLQSKSDIIVYHIEIQSSEGGVKRIEVNENVGVLEGTKRDGSIGDVKFIDFSLVEDLTETDSGFTTSFTIKWAAADRKPDQSALQRLGEQIKEGDYNSRTFDIERSGAVTFGS